MQVTFAQMQVVDQCECDPSYTADLSVVASFIEPIASISAKDDLSGNIVEVSAEVSAEVPVRAEARSRKGWLGRHPPHEICDVRRLSEAIE